ncbi:OmpA family protein [Roseicyclus mahoneyensis]|uniref:OmpA family protein n=1 Tax=Roseicyclus mahoneyensis TaxID=164332 RepID=UPI0014744CA6|nr:OmpA family protein [Roseicyclus mahoneyensis]
MLPAAGLDLDWPTGAELVRIETDRVAGFRIATGPFDGRAVPTLEFAGDLSQEIWVLPDEAGDSTRIFATIEGQLTAQGYTIGFACADIGCGGFDFRFALPIADGPSMHVDLGRFHYLTASRALVDAVEHLAVTISQGGQHGYVHVARVTPVGALAVPVTSSTRQTDPHEGAADAEGVIARLTTTGSAVLSDVTFATGASALAGDRIESLVALAAYLAEDPRRRIVLVGHTDTEGSREANIAVSRARASAVRAYLVDALGADPAQIEAEGIGYLAPRASNSTTAGREANRRVEAVLIAY